MKTDFRSMVLEFTDLDCHCSERGCHLMNRMIDYVHRHGKTVFKQDGGSMIFSPCRSARKSGTRGIKMIDPSIPTGEPGSIMTVFEMPK